jgi:hypothetical protein
LILTTLVSCNSEDQLALGPNDPVGGQRGVDPDRGHIDYADVDSPPGTSGTWKRSWSAQVGSSIDDHSTELIDEADIPYADLEALNCLGYTDASEEDKKRFWALFFSSISLYETDFNPNTRYWERGLNVWSEGLFQLSVSTGRYHSGCEHLSEENILDPFDNIDCAVAVMRNQMRVRGSLFPSRAYYWSVLTSTKKYKVQSFFKSQMSELSFCQL